MDQRRILWIAAAVGVFLLVVIGAALILYAPKQDDSLPTAKAMQEATWMNVPAQSASELPAPPAVNDRPPPLPQTAAEQPGASAVPAQTAAAPAANASASAVPAQTAQLPAAPGAPIQTGNVTVISDSTRVYSAGVTTIDLNSLKSPSQETAQSASADSPPAPAVQPVNPPGAVSKSDVPAGASASVKSSTGVKSSAGAKSSASAKPVTSPKPAPGATTVAAKKPLPSQYWVQAASYNNQKNADAARDSLTANKIPCDVFTYTDSKGTVFYRVRVGPYSTKSEAEYWQDCIARINEFSREQSYVTKSQ